MHPLSTPSPQFMRVLLFIAGTCAAMSASPSAHAFGQCLPQSGDVYLCDPLDGTTTGTQQGGSFIADGWQVNAFGDQIAWDLGAQVTSGTLRLHVRGITLAALNRDNHHFVEVFDHEGGFAHDAKYFTAVRTWSNVPGNEAWFGKLKFQFGATQAGPAGCGDEANLGNWDPNVWQPDRWFELQIGFAQGTATFTIDGTQLATVDYGGCDATLRFINIPNDPWVEGVIDPIVGAVYSTVSFDGAAACEDPCSDGNPCTGNDVCDGASCAGTTLPDGTGCDDGDPSTPQDTCQQGVCVGGAETPDGGTVSDSGTADVVDGGWVPVDGGAIDAAAGDASDAAGAEAGQVASPTGEDGGCGCRLTAGRTTRSAPFACIVGGLLLFLRRRRSPAPAI